MSKGVDLAETPDADDRIDGDFRAQAGNGVVAAAQGGDFLTEFPRDFACGIVQHRFLEAQPSLRDAVAHELENLHYALPPRKKTVYRKTRAWWALSRNT